MEAIIESDHLHRTVSMPAYNSNELELKPLVRSSREKSLYENTKNDESYNELNTMSNDFSNSNIENCNELETTSGRRHRFVRKDGKTNIRQIKITDRMRYIRDFFTTMMDLNWIHMSLIFAGTYFVTWFIFAVLCYWVAYENGDFILDKITGKKHKDVCFTDIDNFLSMFLYSIGTQTTIGLNQNPSEDCAGAMILLMIQMIVSICIEGVLLSIIYLKAIAPAKQINKLKFSDKAVICYRDDELCLLIRVCDPREQQRIESKIRVNLITDKITLPVHLEHEAQNLKRSTAEEDLYMDSCILANPGDLEYSRKLPARVIKKNGRENVVLRRVRERLRYIRDFITTLIELDWRYMLTIFVGSYLISWITFAWLCYMVSYSHGDFFFDEISGERLGDGKDPCIVGVYNFVSVLIYSIETQTTIGFGEKYPSEECPEMIFLFILQIICSIFIEGTMISVIYTKTACPIKYMTKLKFSDKAVICYRDGELCLIFRVCDLRQQQTIDCRIRLYVIVDKSTREDEDFRTHTELKLFNNGRQIIIWPELVCHVIDQTSPLRFLRSAKDLATAHFELYVSIVGSSATTSHITEARTSYLPSEVYWGQRFINIIKYDALNGRYVIDYTNFNSTISVDMLRD